MAAKIIDGKLIASKVKEQVSVAVSDLNQKSIFPGLATIIVGNDAASSIYVKNKRKSAKEVGIESFQYELSENIQEKELLELINELNLNSDVDGILVQLPLPKNINEEIVLNSIKPEKDADGLHPVNLGKLVLQEEGPVPCTPAGIQAMLVYYGIETAGKHVVVIGRGPTLGRPMALLMSSKEQGANAAVTVVHSAVPNLSEITSEADIVIAAVGIPSFVTPEMVCPGSVVISGGISWEGKKLLPDVDESVGEVASWITPRLGGVGPTTVAMLLRNTVEAAERKIL